MKLVSSSAAIVTVGLLAAPAFGDFVPGQSIADPALPGVTSFDGWMPVWNEVNNAFTSTLSATYNPGYPGHPGSGPWPGPIASKQGSDGYDAQLSKTANGAKGGPIPSGESLYFASSENVPNGLGGSVAVSDDTPVANLANVVLQFEIGEASGRDLWDGDNSGEGDLPVLSYNGGTQQLQPTITTLVAKVQNGTFTPPDTGVEAPLYVNTYLFQWDLSGIAEPITSFSIEFSAVEHAQVYAMRLDQSDTYTPIPEPTMLSAAAGALLLLGRRRRA